MVAGMEKSVMGDQWNTGRLIGGGEVHQDAPCSEHEPKGCDDEKPWTLGKHAE